MSTHPTIHRSPNDERLLEVCRTLGESADLDSLLDRVVAVACELTNSQTCAILLYEAETELLKFVAGPSSRKTTSRRLRVPIDRTAAGWVYTHSKPLIIQNVLADSRVQPSAESPLGIEIRNLVAAPLIFRGQTIGVIEILNKNDHADYTENDLTVLETLAAQTAMATLTTLLMDEAERALSEAEEIEKMKSDFIAVAAHELRTPLGLILGHATFLNDVIKDEQQRHQMDVIIRSAMRLKTIIEDLSNVDAYTQGKARMRHKLVAMEEVITRLAEYYREKAHRRRITIATRLPNKPLTVEGDEEKLSLALSNIINNAVTFTNENGHVLIAAEVLPGYVKISVIDDGIGIPAKDLPHVFDRFYQVQSHLTRRHGGMGLGLSVSKAMVELHGGQIWVESVEGKGSNFSILFPMKSENATKPLKTPAFVS